MKLPRPLLSGFLIAALTALTLPGNIFADTTTATTTNGTPTQVTIQDNFFTPQTLTVAAGTTVMWMNNGTMAHTVTADNGSFDSGSLQPGATFSYTFNTPGTYAYYCRFHGAPGGVGMSGTVVVTASTNTNSSNATSTPSSTSTTTPTTTTATGTPLDAPINLAMTASTADSITLSWSPPTTTSSTIAGYNIIRNGMQVATSSAASFIDTGLAAATTYAYNVSAFDSSGNTSPWSVTVFAMTQAASSTTSTTTPPTPPPTSSFNGVSGWLVVPASLYNQWWNNNSTSTSTSTTPSPFTYVNGYPTINGNYYDCYGNVDNDIGHHTIDPNDTDPVHHSGQNCPNGTPQLPSSGSFNAILNGGNGNGSLGPTWLTLPDSNTQWVVVPLTSQNLQILFSATSGGMMPLNTSGSSSTSSVTSDNAPLIPAPTTSTSTTTTSTLPSISTTTPSSTSTTTASTTSMMLSPPDISSQ